MNLIPHSASTLGAAEAEALRGVALRNFAGNGPSAFQLEERFRQRTGRRHAFAVSSGYHALALAVRALDLPTSCSVALPVLTCATVAAAIIEAGHRCHLVDICNDLTIDPRNLSNDIAAIVAPHAYGTPADVAAVSDTGLPWIEDCATSPATLIDGKPVGSFAALAVSLGSTKYITGGTGGVLVTSDDALAARIADLLDFDRTEFQGRWTHNPPVALPGRLADVNAAIALVQLDRLEEFAARRRTIAAMYDAALANLPNLQPTSECPGHSYYRYIVKTAGSSSILAAQLRGGGIDARTSVNPWLDAPRFSGVTFIPGAFPFADSWRDHLLSLPIYPGLTDDDARRVITCLQELSTHA